MFALFLNVILSAAASGDKAVGGFTKFYNDYLNIPGFEAWKFINLAIFVGIMIYILKQPLSQGFKAKREAIRSELIKAEEAKQAALAQLTSAEAKLASLDVERAGILNKAREEAEAERLNILQQTEHEITKMREQAASEINRLLQQAKAELRRFSAEESVRLAEERLRVEINADKDAVLVRSGIQAMGGLK